MVLSGITAHSSSAKGTLEGFAAYKSMSVSSQHAPLATWPEHPRLLAAAPIAGDTGVWPLPDHFFAQEDQINNDTEQITIPPRATAAPRERKQETTQLPLPALAA
jgi:hypothetical protein